MINGLPMRKLPSYTGPHITLREWPKRQAALRRMMRKYADDPGKHLYLSDLHDAIEAYLQGKWRGVVYFVRTKDAEFVKVGHTQGFMSVGNRINELQTGCPHELFVEGFLPGSLQHERRLHKCLEHCHVRGEWFRWCDDIAGVLDAGLDGGIEAALAHAEKLT